MVSVIGYYTTRFGELWDKSLYDLVAESIRGVLQETKLSAKQIDAVFIGNMLAGVLENNLHSTSKVAEILDTHIPVFRAEAACASGGMAFHLGTKYLEANAGKTVLVLGAEKMTDYSPEETTTALIGAASGEEQGAGLTFPGLYALMAQVYLQKYGYSRDVLSYVSYKNHYHGSLNDKAHFQKKITLEQARKSAVVAAPLGVMDCSPISDGAAALILTADQPLSRKNKSIRVLSSEVASDAISLKNRAYIDGIEATKIAADKAFDKARITRSQVGVAEVHDCFTIAELFAMEGLGFWKRGEAGKRITALDTMLGSGGKLIINTSGGLKAAGHPVGATGIKQVGEIYLQLTGQAGKRQVEKAHYGLAHNVGGSGGTAVISIFKTL